MAEGSEEGDSFSGAALSRLVRPTKRLMILVVIAAVLVNAVPFGSPHTSTNDVASDVNRSGALAITGGAFYTSANGTTPAYVNQTVSFWARATTDSAASLTFTIYYDYYLPGSVVNPISPISVNVTGNPGNIVTTFVYDHVGNLSGAAGTYFHARCIITDGISTPITLNRYVYVIENQPPAFNITLEPVILADKGVPKNLSTEVKDPDGDSVDVTWEWGDGSPNAFNVTGPSELGVWCNQTHTWDPYVAPGTGNFYIYTTLNLTLDDGFGNIVVGKYTVKIYVPRNSPPAITLDAPYSAGTNSVVEFRGTAIDVEGEDLTWVFDFKDGSPIEVYHTIGVVNATVWKNVTHAFLSVGTYNVLMNVSDVPTINPGFPHNQSISKTIIIGENQPPGVSDEIIVNDENPFINWTTGNASVIFTVMAADLDGDPLVVTWNFSDGSPEATNTTTGGTGQFILIQVHAYTVTGQYNVTANVTDGQGHWVLTYRLINVSSDNTPPEFVSSNITYPQGRGDYATPNETVYITYILKDDQLDPIRLLINWGDGSPVFNITLSNYVNGTVTYVANHSYTKVGEYIVIVNVTDNMIGKGMHAFNFSLNVKIDYEPILNLNSWSWWDSTTLAILLMIPILIAVWWVNERRKQKALDDAGVTYDQWLVRKKEIQEELRMKKSG